MLSHKHLIVSAKLNMPPTSESVIEEWLKDLIKSIDMEILVGPKSIYYECEGNRGLTAFVIITTSHICLHTWDEEDPARIELDVYSCKDFKVETVFDKLQQFLPSKISYKFLDRDNELTVVDWN